MSQLIERNHPRVRYQATVTLMSPSGQQQISAHASNVSENGMYVRLDRAWPVGSSVLCDVRSAYDTRLIQGRVAWVRTKQHQRTRDSSIGMGIRFVELTRDDAKWLQTLVDNAVAREFDGEDEGLVTDPGTPAQGIVRVSFMGTDQAMQAHVERTTDGVRLRTALPFLTVDAPLMVQEDGSVLQQQLYLRQATLSYNDGHTPHLTLEAGPTPQAASSPEPIPSTTPTPNRPWDANVDAGWDFGDLTDVTALIPAPAAPQARQHEEGFSPPWALPRPRTARLKSSIEADPLWEVMRPEPRRVFAIAALAVAATALFLSWVFAGSLWHWLAVFEIPDRLASPSRHEAENAHSQDVQPPAEADTPRAWETQALPLARKQPSEQPATASTASRAGSLCAGTPGDRGEACPAAVTSRPSPEAGSLIQPSFTRSDGRISIGIPWNNYDGSPLTHYRLSEPAGIAIRLPSGAKLGVEQGYYPYVDSVVSKIWIRRFDGSTQVRIYMRQSVAAYSVYVQNQRLIVTLQAPTATAL